MKNFYTLLAASLLATAAHAGNPYITRVYEYRPAPGQFVNIYPAYTAGDSEADMCRKALELIGDNRGGTVTLGAYGGYITFGFDRPVTNVAGEADLRILGNSFISDQALRPDGGSSEPGIVMVSRDINGNGLPDDPWYEIRGTATGTVSPYTVTYTRPAPDHTPTVSDPAGAYSDDRYIAWSASDGTSGYMPQLVLYTQPYYPQWIEQGSLTLGGTRLPDNAVEEQHGRFKEWVTYPVGTGYADCWPNDDERSAIDLSLAVDEQGNPANLPEVDFVRVYTGVHQQQGALGEVSTEICGAVDLHTLAGVGTEAAATTSGAFFIGDHLHLTGADSRTGVTVYTLSGTIVLNIDTCDGDIYMPVPAGMYIVSTHGTTCKVFKR